MNTSSTKIKDIKREWHLIDVKGKVLGRVASFVASKLMGKHKPYFTRHLDCGDYAVVINASSVVLTGKKEKQKLYRRHSGYPHGFKEEPLEKLRERKPEEIIIHAVKGMLPQNKLRDKMLGRLFVFPEEEHTYKDKLKRASSI